MQVHDIQTGRSGLILLTDRRGAQLPLDPGMPFLAEVVEKEGERVLLSIAGRLLRCETALPLEPGTTVWLAVKEASPQRVALALADPSALPDQDAFPTETWPAPSAGQAPVPLEQALARAVHFLLANGRPATTEAVRSVASVLAGGPKLAETLAAVAELLPQAVEAGALPAGALPPGFLERVQATLEAVHYAPSPPENAAALARQADLLAEAVRRLGLDHEPRLAALLEQLPPASPVLTPAATSAMLWPPAVASAEDDLKGLLLLLRQALAFRPAEAPQAQAAPAPLTPPADQAPATLERLAKVVEDTLHNLTGQRLLAPSQTGQGQERLELYLQIPVAVGDQRHTAEIRLYREGGSRAKTRPERPAALRVSCRLSTTNLGPVRVDLTLRPRGVSEAHLYLSSEPVLALFRAHEPDLRDALGAAGLRLGRVSYSLTPAAPPPEPDGGPSVRLSAIDLRM
ncbi:MAG: flagellar hook-length control protein FliK [Bacillota bacterium]|nr:flagellar hook-length control protein FliK [Bacillota bacterium]